MDKDLNNDKNLSNIENSPEITEKSGIDDTTRGERSDTKSPNSNDVEEGNEVSNRDNTNVQNEGILSDVLTSIIDSTEMNLLETRNIELQLTDVVTSSEMITGEMSEIIEPNKS
jgi:hypothetical protein